MSDEQLMQQVLVQVSDLARFWDTESERWGKAALAATDPAVRAGYTERASTYGTASADLLRAFNIVEYCADCADKPDGEATHNHP